MKLQQIKNYLLLIDEEAEIKAGSYYITNLGNIYKETERFFEEDEGVERFSNRSLYKPIIAYYPLTKEAKELDLPLLPNPFENKVDIVALAIEIYGDNYHSLDQIEAFKKGYKAAQSKQFSLEDMKRALSEAFKASQEGYQITADEIIQSLFIEQLPKEFIPEYRYYYHSSKEFYSDAGFVECSKEQYESIKVEIPSCPLKTEIKTITNSEGREELVGTYKY